jgi:hypothetical protein
VLCTIEDIQNIPGYANTPARPLAWVNQLLGAADRVCKEYIKRDVELTSYVDYYDGCGQRDLVLRQFPAWMGAGFLDPSMAGVVLPQATITVLSTAGFHPGTFKNPGAVPPAVAIQVGLNQWTYVTYTGTTATSFTGCLGGAGTMSLNPGNAAVAPYSVYSPVVFFDPQGYGGQRAAGFGAKTQMVGGVQYALVIDTQGQGGQTPLPLGVRASKRGLLRNIGGGGTWYGGWGYGGGQDGYSGGIGGGKLGGSRLPSWPRCDQGIRVMYNAGFFTIPFDLAYACATLVCQMVRMQPLGVDLSSESLGGYSYSVLMNPTDPAMGDVRLTLMRYREPSFSMGN